MGALGRERGHPSPQRSPSADTGGFGLCTQCPVSSGSDSAARGALLITSWGATCRDSQVQAPALPLWRVLLVPSPLRAASGLVPMRWHFPHGREGPSWCRPPRRLAHARKTSGRPCVFMLLSTNGIFSNGEWEMDLVLKKKKKRCGF